MPPKLSISLVAIPLMLAVPAAATELLSFVDWCNQSQLPAAERHTVDVLLEEAGSQDCNTASNHLQSLSVLDLTGRQIVSLAPLSSFTQLQTLRLDQNQITDLSPLAPLVDLEALYFYQNQVDDIDAIAPLTQLTTLYLDQNQIQDLSPLSGLNKLDILYANSNRIESVEPLSQLPLTQLYLSGNQILEAAPLRSLIRLTHLDLSYNQVSAAAPLAASTRLVSLDVGNNPIGNIGPLSALQQLNKLELFNLPLNRKACPVSPATICSFTDDAAELYQQGKDQLEYSDLDQAQSAFEAALEIYRTTGNRLRESDALDRIGNIYAERGEYANALDYYRDSQAVRQAIGDPQGDIDSLAYLGETYIRLGRTEQAIALLEQALEEYQTIRDAIDLRGTDREGQVQEGLIYRALALAYSRSDNPDQALRFAKLSLADYRKNGDDAGEAIALVRVGEAYLEQGNPEKARLYLNKALRVSQHEGDPAGEARSRYGLGQLAAQQNSPDEAIAQYDQALALWRSLKGQGSGATDDGTYLVGEAETLNAKGALLLEQGKPEAAVDALGEAITAWEQQRPGLTDADKISIIDTQGHTYALQQQALVAMGDIEKALEISERGRSRAFAELLAHRLGLQGEEPSSQQAQPPDIAAIKAIAQAQDVLLVEYSLVGDELYIWVVEPTGEIHFRQRPVEEPLEDMVVRRRKALEIPGGALRNAGIEVVWKNRPPSHDILRPLHQLLIEPIADVLHGEGGVNYGTPVVIIPHQELFLLPFAALPDEAGTMLIDKHPLLFSPAIGVLNASSKRSPLRIGSDTALVVGNPQMPDQPGYSFPLSELPGAEQEALVISPLLNTTPLIDAAATKAAVISQIETASIVHLATHGLLNELDTGVPGALAFTPTPDEHTDGYSDNGYLTTDEISKLTMEARLVVLSACDTGRGRITGDGVVGLSRSFLTAGVESVVVTLWAIDDGTTAELMAEFYQRLQQQPNRAVALQQAMIETRDRYPNDLSKWAAFTLFGAAE